MNRTFFVHSIGRGRARLRVGSYWLYSAVSLRSPAFERLVDRHRAPRVSNRWRHVEQWRRAHPEGLEHSEGRTTSQNGEDGILRVIFERIGATNRVFVEVGSGDGSENITRELQRHGWVGCWVEADPAKAADARSLDLEGVNVIEGLAHPDSICDLVEAAGVPSDVDLLSVDIDGDDYRVLRALLGAFRPRVVVVEYNAAFGAHEWWVLPAKDATRGWDETYRHGASLRALAELCAQNEMDLVTCDSAGVNAFFVRRELCAPFPEPGNLDSHYRPPTHSPLLGGHPRSPRSVQLEMPPIPEDEWGSVGLGPVTRVAADVVAPGSPVLAQVVIDNGTSTTLSSGGQRACHLAVGWVSSTDDSRIDHAPRSPLPLPIRPGSSRSVTIAPTAPIDPGQHLLRVSFLQEHTFWLDDVTTPPRRAHLTVTVST